MKKFATALKLFEEKQPNIEVRSIKRTWKTSFLVESLHGDFWVVDISRNSVERSYPDPEWGD